MSKRRYGGEGPWLVKVRAAVGCPTCDAAAGEACRGRRSGLHAKRWDRFRAITPEAREGLWVVAWSGSASHVGHYSPTGASAPLCGTQGHRGGVWKTPPKQLVVWSMCGRCCDKAGVRPPPPVQGPWTPQKSATGRRLTKKRAVTAPPEGLRVIRSVNQQLGHFAPVAGGVELCRCGIADRVRVAKPDEITRLCRNCVSVAAEEGLLEGWEAGHGTTARPSPRRQRSGDSKKEGRRASSRLMVSKMSPEEQRRRLGATGKPPGAWEAELDR